MAWVIGACDAITKVVVVCGTADVVAGVVTVWTDSPALFKAKAVSAWVEIATIQPKATPRICCNGL
jgi:hypothetical protein